MWNVFAGSQSAQKSWLSHISPLNFFLLLTPNHWSVRSYAIPGEKLSSYFSVESFNILAPSKSVSCTYGPYKKLCEKVIVKHTRGLKLILIKEVPWIFTWRPQRAIRRIKASDPPLYSCKKLERSLKSNGAEPTIFLILTQVWRKQIPPLHTHTS